MAMAPGQPTNISSYIEMALLPATGGLVVGLYVQLETQVAFLFTCCPDHLFFASCICLCVFVYLCICVISTSQVVFAPVLCLVVSVVVRYQF